MLPQIRLDRTERRPLHVQLRDQLRRLVLSGALRPGDRLPPTRSAAREFGVARNIVTLAYEELRLEGYLKARVGRGTWVDESLESHLLAPLDDAADRGAVEDARPGDLSTRGLRLASQRVAPPTEGPPRPFRPGGVAAELFPHRVWLRLAARVWRHGRSGLIPYGDPAGDENLRRNIAGHLVRHRAVRCQAEQVVVTSGSQQALDLVARLLLDEGDGVAVEDPGYLGARAVFQAAGARLVALPVDDQGLDVTGIETGAAAPVRIIYTTSSHQYPLGTTLSLERRLGLLGAARRDGTWIVEDDYDCEFRYGSRALPALQGLDGEGRVIYVGTFSKVLAPGLRMGFLVLPNALVDAFRVARSVLDHHPPLGVQATLAEFMGEGHLERHVLRLRTVYAERRERLVGSLADVMGKTATVVPSSAGLHVCVLLDPGVDDVAVSREAAARGVEAPPLSLHFLGRARRPGLVLGFGSVEPEDIRPAVEVLARAHGAVVG